MTPPKSETFLERLSNKEVLMSMSPLHRKKMARSHLRATTPKSETFLERLFLVTGFLVWTVGGGILFSIYVLSPFIDWVLNTI